MARASQSIDADPEAGGALTQGGNDPERDALASEWAAQVQAALLRLSPPLREVILLREYEGLDYRQIAAITKANEAAVRKRYSRGLAQLASLLKQKEP